MLTVDPNALPKDVAQLHKLVVELCEKLKHETSEKDKYQSLLRELLDAQRNRKSEQLSKDQLALFETLWKANQPDPEEQEKAEDAEAAAEEEQKPEKPEAKKRSGRQPLARHLVRERVIHDLAESEKRCNCCGKDLHLVGEETSERYEFIPAVMKVVEDVRLKYACDCTMKRADKPAQPVEKSTAGASVLAQVIVSKSPIICRCTARKISSRATESKSRERRWGLAGAMRRPVGIAVLVGQECSIPI